MAVTRKRGTGTWGLIWEKDELNELFVFAHKGKPITAGKNATHHYCLTDCNKLQHLASEHLHYALADEYLTNICTKEL